MQEIGTKNINSFTKNEILARWEMLTQATLHLKLLDLARSVRCTLNSG